jgi:hypothetical protein
VSTLAIILIALGAVLVALFIGGVVASGRRRAQSGAHLREQLEEADSALAAARAQDRGWDRERLELAARVTFGDRRPQEEISDVQLVQVIDKPGTDSDIAVLRVLATSGHEEMVTLGRRSGEWVSAEGL